MTRTPEQIQQMCVRLRSGEYHSQALEVTLDEFQKFHTTILHLSKTPPIVSLVNLETVVKAQFSDISPQHFDIVHNGPLTEQHFEFALNKKWYGAEQPPQKFWPFMWEELKHNYPKLAPLFITSLILLCVVNSDPLYALMATLLIQSSTVFLSIYLIFTVAQSQTLYKDISLFKPGTLQQYYNDDRNVTLLGILTVALTFLSSGVVSLASEYISGAGLFWLQIVGRVLKALSTTIVITLLFDTFLIVADYYLDRSRDVIERDMASDILHQDFEEFSTKNDQTR
jgi:cation transport ATPase